MPTRRALLRAGGAAALAGLAGCSSTSLPFRDATSDPTSTGAGQFRLDVETVPTDDVADGATVGVASPTLHELVADAAESDGRVDLRTGGADSGETLALAAFEYLAFAGETYEPTASFARFAEEASYQYEAAAVDGSEVGGNETVLGYGDLTDEQRAVADDLLDDGSYEVGHHEEKPDAVERFEQADYLRADGDLYRVLVAVGDHVAHHMLSLDAADPGEDARVVTVPSDPPAADWSAVLRDGTNPGSVGVDDVPEDDALVAYLRRVDYVATATSVLDVSVTETVQ